MGTPLPPHIGGANEKVTGWVRDRAGCFLLILCKTLKSNFNEFPDRVLKGIPARRHLSLNLSFQKIKSKTAMDAFEVEEVNISSSIAALTHLLSEFIEGQVRFPQTKLSFLFFVIFRKIIFFKIFY